MFLLAVVSAILFPDIYDIVGQIHINMGDQQPDTPASKTASSSVDNTTVIADIVPNKLETHNGQKTTQTNVKQHQRDKVGTLPSKSRFHSSSRPSTSTVHLVLVLAQVQALVTWHL